jgi:amino acid transporter
MFYYNRKSYDKHYHPKQSRRLPVNRAMTDLTFGQKLRRTLIGAPRNISDPSLFHKISLIPILAWIGLGADGLSSSSYGPEEAFRAIGEHTYLALPLALATAITVSVIAYAYSRIIEHFPHGGGGYVVATRTIGEKAGVISGSALLVDYMLTITVSIAACADALFSFLPLEYHKYKIPFAALAMIGLIVINLRGVKESVKMLAPIFITFIATHAILLGYGIFRHAFEIGPIVNGFHGQFQSDLSSIGWLAILVIFLRAFSLGGGTYTGLEAVSNGLQIMREPKVHTGKRTMLYMAISLAAVAGGLLLCYLLLNVRPITGRTMNAILAEQLFSRWPFGYTLALITILSEGALLIVGAQAGFIDGPRVMANMAIDYWFPRRFASLSERLSMQNGVLMMGITSLILLFATRGSVSTLIVLYSINVFLTFSLSQLGMSRYFIKRRDRDKKWLQHLSVHIVGLILCLTILMITIAVKFKEGGWITLLITSLFVLLCYVIRNHYKKVRKAMSEFDTMLKDIPTIDSPSKEPVDPKNFTAIQLVAGYNGFGIHTFLSVVRNFPHVYKNFVFVSVAVVDSGSFKGSEDVDALKNSARDSLEKYVQLARNMGIAAEYRLAVGTDVVDTATDLCEQMSKEFPRSTVFAGQLTFMLEKFFHRFLHNETSFAIQRRLQWKGITTVILPMRINP